MMATLVEPEDLYKLRPLAQPVSDGQRVYYIESRLDEAKNQSCSAIYSVSLSDGHDRRRWSPAGVTANKLVLSASRRYLAFTGVVANHSQLFLVDVSGGAPEQITHGDADVTDLVWAIDADALYYQTTAGPVANELPAVKVIQHLQYQENGVGLLPQDRRYQCIRYQCVDGDQSLVLSRTTPFTVSAANEAGLLYNQSRLPNDEHDFSEGVYWHSFNDDVDHLLNDSVRAGAFSQAQLNQDGRHIVMWGQDNHIPNVSQFHAWLGDVVGTPVRDLTTPRDVEVGNMLAVDSQQRLRGQFVAWLDATTVLTLENEQGRLSLVSQGINGEQEPQILLGGDRAITDFSVVDGRTVVFTETTMTSVSRLKALDLVSGIERDLVNPNVTYEAKHALVDGERFIFKGAGDWPIEGWYFAPVNHREQHPAVLYVHGGPQVDFGYGFYHELQYLTGQGYGVIAINPRGGNSYGQDFEAAVIGHYGEGDFADLMLGVDAALELDPTIDDQQLCVTGGSYGGFMTNWIETHTNRFAAAVTQRSIANWISFYGTSDIGYYFTPWELQAGMQDIQALWHFSPLAYVERAQTPILILHGEEDLRCPTTQGKEFFVGLKEAGVETQLVLFPQANHDLSRSGLPNLRIDRLKRINQWFQDHLPKEDMNE
ncbi:dipeptidyl aminopeptidase acylaminoacyl-peptidase [Levilactobacillus senmaizukei DSM 21775 = NBRC 103853]|uniref:Dipeptidyl aminopeptidase acylaminoacyl-peptidase n=1 Tax=Levilactobacillus senmaizukei DSM 21775 = NBRC 103853 TaxID=1423803 RepID=A0A0R2DDQ1_9LACO|nr:S9 family peptidase [Levilactobacillus senmaizukei]KRN01638.1 dipeptidyl aminopeptidase acylaminoacyl-peptidase [Levilactobacillus senmaizukei DSM 21775 = NBRC 103853]